MMDKVYSQDPRAQGTYPQCQTLIATQGDGCQELERQWEDGGV